MCKTICYHIGHCNSDYIYNKGQYWPLINRTDKFFNNENRNKWERKLESYRKQFKCGFSRYKSLFVSPDMETAYQWALVKMKSVNRFYIYKLEYDGKISWHDECHYNSFCELLSQNAESELLQKEAKMYWTEIEPKQATLCEGLLVGSPLVIDCRCLTLIEMGETLKNRD